MLQILITYINALNFVLGSVKNGLDLTLETVRAPQLDEATLVWAFNLVSTNMKPLYLAAYSEDADMDREFGWKEKEKKEELREDAAWYLLARTSEGTPVAFSHFRWIRYFCTL